MSTNTSKTLNIGTQIDGYVIYAVYADRLALGRALSPESKKQYALIANKRYARNIRVSEWFINNTYTDQHIAEKNFVNKCFSWSEFWHDELNEPEPLDDEITPLSRRYLALNDDTDKTSAAMKEIKETRDAIRHSNET